MYKRLIILITVLFNLLNQTYANRGNSLTYKSLEYTITEENFDPNLFINDLNDYLKSYYSVKIDRLEKYYIKYDLKKFLHYEDILIVRNREMYVKLSIDIIQQQPYLFYRKKKNDFRIYFSFTRYIHENEKEDDISNFINELDEIIGNFTKKYNFQ
ncbi:MAG: hypothetical protein Q4P16_08895 [Spirochaetales bacterium]|nr:hypothetical protein [Spirochaetales bacterium]